MDRTILRTHSDALERRASLLAYYTKHRVSHTAAGLIRCILSIVDMVKEVQSDDNFVKLLRRSFEMSHDKSGGSYEITTYDDGTVWISGSFHISELRKYLITVPQAVQQIEMERTDG